MTNNDITENRGEIIIYRAEDNTVQLDVRMENDTVWLTASQMAMLFGKEESNIRRHIINIFRDEEVPRENNVHFLHVNGVKKPAISKHITNIFSQGELSLEATVFKMETVAIPDRRKICVHQSN